MHKYRAERVSYDHHSFASKFEGALYLWLKLREKNDEIFEIKCQETVYLTDAKIIYKPDFSYFDINSGTRIYAEAKGYETSDWRIKRKLWMFYGPGKLEIYKGSANNFKLYETLDPQSS